MNTLKDLAQYARFVVCGTAMKNQFDTVEILAEELGFDPETLHDMMIMLAAKTIRWNIKAGNHPFTALDLADLGEE